MNGTQVSILKEADKVCFRCFLKSKHSSGLETQICLEILRNLTDETLERSLADEEISRLLVTTDLTKSYSSWTVAVRFLYSTCSWCRLTGSLKCLLE